MLKAAPLTAPSAEGEQEPPRNATEAALLEAAITPRTRVMLVSHVVFVTGQVHPVREIVRRRGVVRVICPNQKHKQRQG